MKVVKDSNEASKVFKQHSIANQTIGLVPTMGALHAGHLSLVKKSLQENNITVVSIFVNPIQFNNPDDYAKYPASIEQDLATLEKLKVDYVFMPSREDIYPHEPLTRMSFGHLDSVMEGKHRPGHFSGVAIIVAKLFNILNPTRAYFGQKDLQQVKIIERLVIDLSIGIELVIMPIIREANGLAMSSRNRRLSDAGIQLSANIYKALNAGANILRTDGNTDDALLAAREILVKYPEIEVEYLEIANFEDLRTDRTFTKGNPLVLCFAGSVEGVRLIDNVVVGQK